jgi:hypothetical protein
MTLASWRFICVSACCMRWMHVLKRAHVIAALAPVGAGDADDGGGMERVAEQAVGVQLQQPLTLLHVALPPREILRVARVDQEHLEAAGVEDLVQRHPVDAGGLHRDRGDATPLEPLGQSLEVRGETVKPAHRLGIPIRPDRDVVRAVPHVNPGGVGMDHREPRVLGSETSGQRFPLRAVQPARTWGCHAGPPCRRPEAARGR